MKNRINKHTPYEETSYRSVIAREARAICLLVIGLLNLYTVYTASAQAWPGPTFHEFSGENNGGPSDSLIGSGLGWNRPGYGYYPDTYCIYWGYLEPSRGTWDLTHLTNYGSLIQSWPTGSSNTLVLLDGWPSWEPSTNPSVWLPDWTNYVDKVVSYLYAPPFNCRYFQVWNEAFPNNGGFWPDSSWSDYFNYVHFPAAQVIQSYPGAKVVYGGYPSRSGASVDDYTNRLTTYNAWSSIDVLDIHYYSPFQWARLRSAADSRGFTNMAIWQSEVGFGGYSSYPNSYVANEYPRAFAWALTNNWNVGNKYKWIYYSSWASDGSGLYTGSPATLTCHGQQMQELGRLLSNNVLSAYSGVTGSLSGLNQLSLIHTATSLEAVTAGNQIVTFVHLSPTDWTNNSTVSLTFPISSSSVASAQRVDLTGNTVNLTTTGTTTTSVSVATQDASGSSALAWNTQSVGAGYAATFYVVLTTNVTNPPPAAPTSLIATAGNAVVSLNWVQSASPNIIGNNVYRSTAGSGGPYTLLANLAATTSYLDTAVVNGSTYYYSVSAVNTNGESSLSAYAGATPTAPGSLVTYEAEDAVLSGVIVGGTYSGYTGTGYADYQNASGDYIEWTVNAASSGTSQLVFRYANGGIGDRPLELKVNGVVANSSLNFPVTGSWSTWLTVTNGVTLNAGNNTVRLTDTGSSGGNLDNLQVLTSGGGSPPVAPTGLTATAGNAQVALIWTASTGATSYNVKRATVSGGPYTTIASPTTASYTDTTAVNGTTYYYVVSAVNGSGESANSTEVSATPSAPVAPAAPTSLTASAGHKKVSLTWAQSTSPNITNNKVYRATVNGGPYSLVTTIAATTTYADANLTTGTTYYYVITAVNASSLESPYSTQASATAK